MLADARNAKSLCTSPLSTKRNCQTAETQTKLCPNKAYIFFDLDFLQAFLKITRKIIFYSLALFSRAYLSFSYICHGHTIYLTRIFGKIFQGS